MDIDQELRDLEEGMWRSETRGDRRWMEERLAPDFEEFGQSGRSYSRDEMLNVEVGDMPTTMPLRNLSMRRLSDAIVIVTYQSEMNGRRANRCSIWRQTGTGWLMEFHQGTPTESD